MTCCAIFRDWNFFMDFRHVSNTEWIFFLLATVLGFPAGASGKEPSYQCKRHKRCGFDPWVGKIPWRRAFSSILSWRIPMDRGAWQATDHGVA